jgi:DNA ligase-associated metallophosphoesterase
MTHAARTQAPIRLNGADLIADLSGALWWPDRRILAVADLHLEKGSAFAARGTLLPPYDTASTLARLLALVERFAPARVIAVGDSFHDRGAGDRLSPSDGRLLAGLTAAVRWTWIAGNHDPAPPEAWGGEVAAEVVEGPIVFRHQAAAAAAGEVSGHYHPKITLRVRGRRVGGPCFIEDGNRLVLPAFGAYAGGLEAATPSLARLFTPPARILLLGRDRLHELAAPEVQVKREEW